MELEKLWQDKREHHRIQIRKQNRQLVLSQQRATLLKAIISGTPAQYFIRFDLEDICQNLEDYCQGKRELVENSINAILGLISIQRDSQLGFNDNLFGLLKEVFRRVEKEPRMMASIVQNKIAQIFSLLVTYNFCSKSRILEFNLIHFFKSILDNDSVSLRYILCFLAEAVGFKDLEEEIFKETELIDKIIEYSLKMLREGCTESFKYLLQFWCCLDVRGPAFINFRNIHLTYNLAWEVISNYGKYLYEQQFQLNEDTVLSALVMACNILQEYPCLMDDQDFSFNFTHYTDILRINTVSEARKPIFNILRILTKKSHKVCLGLVDEPRFVSQLMKDLAPSNCHTRYKILWSHPALYYSIEEVASRFPLETNREAKLLIWNIVEWWFLFRVKASLSDFDRSILRLLLLNTAPTDLIERELIFWREMVKRGFREISPYVYQLGGDSI